LQDSFSPHHFAHSVEATKFRVATGNPFAKSDFVNRLKILVVLSLEVSLMS
jgi:hypothetical protein